MQEHIHVKSIAKAYNKKKVIEDISLSIKQGSITGLLGPNGAGKTTTFYSIVGFIRPDSGHIFLNDLDLTNVAMHKRARLGLGYLPQEACIFRKLTVEENILAILEFVYTKSLQRKQKLEELLINFDIAHIRKSFGYSLSGGERRRVEIARCLATNPKFLLLDEPFAGVDPLMVADIQKIIIRLAKQNIGILINDHNARETLDTADINYIISQGKILLRGNKQEIINSELARKAYFGDNYNF